MKLALYQIDAFTDKTFGGNPACVVPLEYWLPDELLLKIAQENGVAETRRQSTDTGESKNIFSRSPLDGLNNINNR